MKRKTAAVRRLRLSPNEEQQLIRDELERRRKLRLQQVREQERYIAQQVRREVRERRQKELETLAENLQEEWQQQREEKLQTLAKLYEDSLQSVGQGQRSAKENEIDLEALAQKSVERQVRAEERHREALRELTTRRHEEEEQRCRHIQARKKALVEEKKRAAKVARLPPPPPDPIECIGKIPLPVKSTSAERFSITHYHMPETAVDREDDTEQPDARQAAEVEFQRLEELQQEQARDRQEKLEKARQRGSHALRKEQHTQDRARLLGELEHLQQADLLRRRQAVNRIPAQIFQPLYRQQELRDDQQRNLEIAFQDMYTEERKVKGDLVLQLVPEPLPSPSASSHDEDLDVTLDPEGTPAEEGEEPDAPAVETPVSSVPTGDSGRQALRRLLDRIRNQRNRQSQQESDLATTSREADAVTDFTSIESGSLSSQEREQPAAGPEEQTSSITHSEEAPEVSDEPIVEGTVLLPEEQARVIRSPETGRKIQMGQQTDEMALLTQQREQLALLEELEEKRRELEQRLREAHQERHELQDAAQRHSESGTVPERAPEVKPLTPVSDDPHTQRLHQYQQRLLEQNRRHKKCVDDARRRLEEYQRTLKLRYASRTTAAQTLQPSSVTIETLRPLPPPHIRTLPDHQSGITPIINPDTRVLASEDTRNIQQTPLKSQITEAQGSHLSPPKSSGSHFTGPSVVESRSRVSLQHAEDVLPEETPQDPRLEDPLRDRASEQDNIPLPPPSVVLELLRSQKRQTSRAAASSVPPSVPTSTQSAALLQQQQQSSLETDRQETVRQQMKRQRDALQALITAQNMQGTQVSSSGIQGDQVTLMNTLLKAIEEFNPPPAASQSNESTSTPLPLSNDPVSRGRVKPPVSRPPARLAFLQRMEQHELSAIQEVDTPVNISLDTELQSGADDAELSDSSSVSLPGVTEGSQSVSERSQVTGRISRLSWRDTLLLDSAASQRGPSQINHQQEQLVDPDYLSSTTISTGSYSTSEQEHNGSITDVSLICMEPVSRTESSISDLTSRSSYGHVIANKSPETSEPLQFRSNVQQIIDKYTRELDSSLKTAGSHTGVLGTVSSLPQSWSSVLQHDVKTDASLSHDGHAADHMSSVNSAADLSSSEVSGDFLPLQPHADIDSSSTSSSSRNLRSNHSSRTREWNNAVNRIIEHFSDQLSIRRSNQGQRSTLHHRTSDPSTRSSTTDDDQEKASEFSRLIGRLSDESSQSSLIMSTRQNSTNTQSSVSQISNDSASPPLDQHSDSNSSVASQLPDQSASHVPFEGCESVLSQLIGKASDIESSQVLDQSSALTDGLQEMMRVQQTLSTAAVVSTITSVGGGGTVLSYSPEKAGEVDPLHLSAPEPISPALQDPEEDRNDFTVAPHDGSSDFFLPLPTEVTHNETLECSVNVHVPLEAEMSECTHNASTSDWLDPTDPTLPSFRLSTSLQQLRADTSLQSQPDLQISMEQLSLTESLCETVIMIPPSATDISYMPHSPSMICLQEESPELAPELPSKSESSTDTSQHQSAVEGNVVARLWERAQQVADGKGILEESTISFISLPESTLQDPDVTLTEGCTERDNEVSENEDKPSGENDMKGKSDHSESNISSSIIESNIQSNDPAPSFPHAVMLLESSSTQLQEAFLRKRHELAQRSARRAAEIKAKKAESGKMTRVVQKVSKPTSSSLGVTVQKSETGTVSRLKSVGEVKICTPEQRRLEELKMYQRTERLYNQLEEVKQRKELHSRQEAYAKNREKAKEFQRKTLEKLRTKQKK